MAAAGLLFPDWTPDDARLAKLLAPPVLRRNVADAVRRPVTSIEREIQDLKRRLSRVGYPNLADDEVYDVLVIHGLVDVGFRNARSLGVEDTNCHSPVFA